MKIASALALFGSLATTGAFTTPYTSIRIQRNEPLVVAPSQSHVKSLRVTQTRPITRLFMGWGPEPIWSTGFVSNTIQACPSGSCVSLKVQVEDGNGFTLPGQYVQVRPSGGEYYLLYLSSAQYSMFE